MKEYSNKPVSKSRTPDSSPQASKQAPIFEILQAYRNSFSENQPVQWEDNLGNTGSTYNLKAATENRQSPIFPVTQLKSYDEKFQEEKAKVVDILKELKLAGISGKEVKDFTWHHKYPHSKLKESPYQEISKLKDSRSYIALGPNPAIRFDDPGNEGVDFNYKPHDETDDEEAREPLTPRFSRKLKDQHELSGFDQLNTGIRDNMQLHSPVAENDRISKGKDPEKMDVISEWSQWFIPDEEIKNIITIVSVSKIEKKILEAALQQEKDFSSEEDICIEAVRILTGILHGLLHNYIILELKDDGKFQEVSQSGVPITELTPGNLKGFHSILDKILKSTPKWLKRGSMGSPVDEEKKQLFILDQSKYESQNITKIAGKFDEQQAVKLIETTKVTPDANKKVQAILAKFGLQHKLGSPLVSPKELGNLITQFKSSEEELLGELEKRIEDMLEQENDLELLMWCAKYLDDELDNDQTQGQTMQNLKTFLEQAALKTSKKGGGEREQPSQSPNSPKSFTEELADGEYRDVAALFNPGGKEWEDIPQLLQSHGNDPLSIMQQTVRFLIHVSTDTGKESEEDEEDEEDEGAQSWYPGAEEGSDKYEPFFWKEDHFTTPYDIFKEQQQIGDYDLSEEFEQQGLKPDIIAMLALKAYILDFFIHNPKLAIKNKDTRQSLAQKIVADVKAQLEKQKENWEKKLEDLRKKTNKAYLESKIRDYMYEITPRKGEHKADWEKRLQDEVCERILQDLNSTYSREKELPGKSKSPSESTLEEYLENILPPLVHQSAENIHGEVLGEVQKHLQNYIDPITKTFNISLWNDVKGQIYASLNIETIRLYDQEAIKMAASPIVEPPKIRESSGVKDIVPPLSIPGSKVPNSIKSEKMPQNEAHLQELLYIENNPGGGDCLFYALSESTNQILAANVRQEIATQTVSVSRHELMTILNETPGLSRFANRVPILGQEADVSEIYRQILQTPHTWGGRTDIATFARIRNRRVAVVEIEQGGIESVRVYNAQGAQPETLAPTDDELVTAFTDSLILVHYGGNHWMLGRCR